MNEPYTITIYRRNNKMWVSPGILSDTGFDSLNGIIPVQSPDALPHTLESAAAQARAAQKLPPEKRFPKGTPFWEAAGFRSWKEFLRGTTAVRITRMADRTLLEYDVPDAQDPMLTGTDIEREYPPDEPLANVARVALGLLAANPG